MPSSSFIWMGQSGCLLPLLIILNLLFGRAIFNSIHLWLGIEAALLLLFIIKLQLLARKITQQFGQSHKSHGKVIDVQGEVVEEKKKLK